MMSYTIEKTEENIIITPEPVVTYINKTTGTKFQNDKEKNIIQIKHNKRDAKYNIFSYMCIDQIIIPTTETVISENSPSIIFKTGKGATVTLEVPIQSDTFVHTVDTFVNPCYIDVYNDYLMLFVNTVLMDIYSNRKVLDYVVNGITPVNYLVFGEKTYYFNIDEIYHNKLILSVLDEDGEPVNTSFWSVTDDNDILINSNGDTIGFGVEFYPVIHGEAYEISNDPVNVKEIGAYRFKNNNIILYFEENTLKVEKNKQALILTIAKTGENAGTGKIRLVRVIWYNLKEILLSENPGNDWILTVPNVVGNLGETIELSGQLTNTGQYSPTGKIRFYIIN